MSSWYDGNSIDGFSIMARPQLIPGMIIPFQLRLYNSTGFEQLTYFNLPIGTLVKIHHWVL
jgi:hypothetical protein